MKRELQPTELTDQERALIETIRDMSSKPRQYMSRWLTVNFEDDGTWTAESPLTREQEEANRAKYLRQREWLNTMLHAPCNPHGTDRADVPEIIRLATMVYVLETDDECLHRRELTDDLTHSLNNLDTISCVQVAAASKLMQGEGFDVKSSNPETISRFEPLARELGASIEQSGNTFSLHPPPGAAARGANLQ